MANYSLFEELGITIPEEETKKAEPKKDAKKTETKKGGKKPAEKKEEKLSFPLTVLTGVCPPTVLTKEQAGDADTLEKINDLICNQTRVPHALTVAKKLTSSKVAVVLDLDKVQAKGEFDIAPISIVFIGENEIALHELEGKRTPQEINDYLAAQTGERVLYQFIAEGNNLYAIPGDNVAVGSVTLPVTIKSPLGSFESVVLNASDFELEEGGTEVEVDDVKDKLFEMDAFKELEPILELARPSEPKDDNILYVTLKRITKTIPTGGPTKATYPTNAVISMLFNRIQLTPEMFGGREKVDEADIIVFLAKDYPEFTPARTRLTYDKEGNFIFPALKSSSKGAVTYGSRKECLAAAEEQPIYFLANYIENGTEVRYEKTPISVVEASAGGTKGRFQWNLPKIPKQILEVVREFLGLVSDRFETEALVQIGYRPDDGKYEVIIPVQTVDKISVKTEEMFLSTSRLYHVLDIHSHNTMPAFFSVVDNEDEKANRVYGVMGSFDRMGEKKPEMLFRAATGGRFVSLSVADVFSDAEVDEEDVPLAEALFDDWLNNAVTFM